EMGQWSTFTDPSQVEAMERHLEAQGVLAAHELQALFSVVRANDLIWSSVVSHYLLDKEAPPSDILHWFADGAHIPKAFLRYWTNARMPATAEAWMETATRHEGSWWPHWQQWLVRDGAGQVKARKPKKPIEPAPGSYVRMR